MSYLEDAENKKAELIKKKEVILNGFRVNYELEDEELYEDLRQVESALYEGAIDPAWDDARDYEYVGTELGLQGLLIKALQLYEKQDNKSLHNANKAFEELVRQCRGVRKSLREDIEKAEQSLETVEEIITICDNLRR